MSSLKKNLKKIEIFLMEKNLTNLKKMQERTISSLSRKTTTEVAFGTQNGATTGVFRGRKMNCQPKEVIECKKTMAWECEPVCEPVCKPVCEPVCKPACEPICKPVCEPVCKPACEPVCKPACETRCHHWLWYIIWFFIAAIIIWFILFALKPEWLQTKDEQGNPTGEIDQGKLLITAIVIAIIIVILIWIFQWACGYRGYGYGY